MMLEPVPPGQQPIIMMTIACTGITWKANDRANAVKGMMPNWQRNPMMMPQGLLTWPHSFSASTVQPMENMTMASMMVSVVLIARLRIWLKLSGGTRQFAPEHTVARESHLMCTADVAMAAGLGVRSRCYPCSAVREGEDASEKMDCARRALCCSSWEGRNQKLTNTRRFMGSVFRSPCT